MGAYTIAIDNALHEKWPGMQMASQTAMRLSSENFYRENVDELIKIRQIHQYFPPSKFCAIRYFLWSKIHILNHISTNIYSSPQLVTISWN